jgi:small subunit ribosomal protein S1
MIDIGAKTAAFMPMQEVSINRVEGLSDVLQPSEIREFFIMSEENEDGQLSLSIRELNINELGRELDNYKKKMQLFILRFLLPIEEEHLFE